MNPLAEWKAAMEVAKRQRRLMRLTDQMVKQVADAATRAAAVLAPRRPDGKLHDGKEIRDGGGRVVGLWRYRGGSFQPDFFS